MLRDPLPPERVAAGWALGMFIGCSVPFGCQLVISVPLSALLRISKIGGAAGTLITNPLTIFFIYPFQTWAADRLFLGGSLGLSRLMEMDWSSWTSVKSLGSETLTAFFTGGLALALILSPATYFAVLAMARASRRRRSAAS